MVNPYNPLLKNIMPVIIGCPFEFNGLFKIIDFCWYFDGKNYKRVYWCYDAFDGKIKLYDAPNKYCRGWYEPWKPDNYDVVWYNGEHYWILVEKPTKINLFN